MRYGTLILAAVVSLGMNPAMASAHWNTAAIVNGWYHQYLHRPVDPEGLRTWTAYLRQGASPVWVQANLLGSEEYFLHHGACPRRFVAGLYADVLGRPATIQEIHAWVRQLACGGCRVQLALAFLQSAEQELAFRAQPTPFLGPQPRPARWQVPPPPLVPDDFGARLRGPDGRFSSRRIVGNLR
jgi:hypothetical protein